MKKRVIITIFIVLAVVLYEVLGLYLPFSNYKEITNKAELDYQVNEMMRESESSDRAMILETNESALEERIRLANMAKEKIIISTLI